MCSASSNVDRTLVVVVVRTRPGARYSAGLPFPRSSHSCRRGHSSGHLSSAAAVPLTPVVRHHPPVTSLSSSPAAHHSTSSPGVYDTNKRDIRVGRRTRRVVTSVDEGRVSLLRVPLDRIAVFRVPGDKPDRGLRSRGRRDSWGAAKTFPPRRFVLIRLASALSIGFDDFVGSPPPNVCSGPRHGSQVYTNYKAHTSSD